MILSGRTDLAAEAHSRISEGSHIPGVRFRETELRGLPVSELEILDAEAAAAIGKPQGKYYTLALPRRFSRGAESFAAAAEALAELLRRLIPSPPPLCLVAALGNPDISPDALGSLAAGSILVTRHLKQQEPEAFKGFAPVALCRPGVLGTSGMESARQVACLQNELGAGLVLVIDALAGAELQGLCRTIQVTDAGLAPGSGVGNDRQELSRQSLGVPVVAVGMPTVIDAESFGGEELKGHFVTPRSIDSLVRQAARVIGYGVDLSLHPGLTLSDIDMLIG